MLLEKLSGIPVLVPWFRVILLATNHCRRLQSAVLFNPYLVVGEIVSCLSQEMNINCLTIMSLYSCEQINLVSLWCTFSFFLKNVIYLGKWHLSPLQSTIPSTLQIHLHHYQLPHCIALNLNHGLKSPSFQWQKPEITGLWI